MFDKTGTLTAGKMSVAQMHVAPGVAKPDILRSAVAVERYSEHSVAKVIVAKAAAQQPNYRDVSVAGQTVLLGSAEWLTRRGIALDAKL